MKPWQRVFLFGSAFGIGFAIAIIIIMSLISWYQSRPVPRNTKAITAEYLDVDINGIESPITYTFRYQLKNNTDKDWQINENDDLKTVLQLNDNVISELKVSSKLIKIDRPLFIPAHAKMNLRVSFTYTYNKSGDEAIEDAIKSRDPTYLEKKRKYIIENISNHMPGFHGFRIFDDKNRYEIYLPDGWRETPKKK